MKLKTLLEKADPNNFNDSRVYHLANTKNYNKAFDEATGDDVDAVMQVWLEDNLDGLTDWKFDKDSVKLFTNWYRAFNSLEPMKNPFIYLAQQLKKDNQKLKYNDWAVINNKYAENIILNDDLYNSELLVSPYLYKVNNFEDQAYIIDVYTLYSQPDEVNKSLNVWPTEKVGFGDKEYNKKDLLKDTDLFRDLVIFKDGDNKNELRSADEIEEIIKSISYYMQNTKQRPQKKSTREIEDEDELNDFLKRNEDILKKGTLLSDLKTYLMGIEDL